MNGRDNPPTLEPELHAGHEITDVCPRSIGLFALGLVLMIALVLSLLGWTYRRFEAAARRADPVPSQLSGDQKPPAPRLQVQPVMELKHLRQEEEQRLSSYGWIDPEEKVVRIPIRRAMDLLAKRGLPERIDSRESLPSREADQ